MLARSSCRSVADGGGKLYTYGIRSTELRSMARTIRRQIRPSRKSGDECRYDDIFQEKAGQGGCLPRRILSVLHTWHISACFPASPCAQIPFAIQSPVSGFPREGSPANHYASNCVMLLSLALRHILSRLENSGSCLMVAMLPDIRQSREFFFGKPQPQMGTKLHAKPINMRRPATFSHKRPGNNVYPLAQRQRLRWWLQ